jgi:hypothetical protein
MNDIAAPAAIPATTPNQRFPVVTAVAKPAIAPTSIIPSTPRLSTPDFSVTSSPNAANTIGVPAAIAAARMAMRVSIMRRLPSIARSPLAG